MNKKLIIPKCIAGIPETVYFELGLYSDGKVGHTVDIKTNPDIHQAFHCTQVGDYYYDKVDVETAIQEIDEYIENNADDIKSMYYGDF